MSDTVRGHPRERLEKPVTALPADTRGILNPQAGASRFGLTRHAPGPEVQARVERHWIVRWDLRGQSPFTQEVLPHPCVNLVFEGGEGRVYGVVRSKFSRRLEGAGVGVGTKFRPGAFAGFTDVPMASLVGRSLPARDVFGAEIAACDDVVAQVATVERFLAERMPDADPGYDLTRLALDLGYFDLAHFTRHFRRVVGRSPTAFLRA